VTPTPGKGVSGETEQGASSVKKLIELAKPEKRELGIAVGLVSGSTERGGRVRVSTWNVPVGYNRATGKLDCWASTM
jgi:hypothetical protein